MRKPARFPPSFTQLVQGSTQPEPAGMPRAYNPQRTLLHHWRGTVLPRIWFPMLLSCAATIVRRSILRSCAAA